MDEKRDEVGADVNAGADEVVVAGVDADGNGNPEKTLAIEGAAVEVAGAAEATGVTADEADDDEG